MPPLDVRAKRSTSIHTPGQITCRVCGRATNPRAKKAPKRISAKLLMHLDELYLPPERLNAPPLDAIHAKMLEHKLIRMYIQVKLLHTPGCVGNPRAYTYVYTGQIITYARVCIYRSNYYIRQGVWATHGLNAPPLDAPLCSRMHRGAARSASLMAGSQLGTSAAWLKWCLGISSWEPLARGSSTHPGVCNNSTWRMYACAEPLELCTRMHQGVARSASLVADSSRCISQQLG